MELYRITRKDITALATLIIVATSFTACNILDDTDDCQTALRVKFEYKYNMKYADAFDHEVKTVNFRAYDEDGRLVMSKKEAVSGEDWTLNVDGLKSERNYDFHVWAEGVNRGDSYTYGTENQEKDLSCLVNRETETDGTEVVRDLTELYHGRKSGVRFANTYGTTQTVTMGLTKNTNHLKIVLQELNEKSDLHAEDFTFSITDDNGLLAYDNMPVTGHSVTYTPWSVYTGTAGIGKSQPLAAEDGVRAVVAELTLNRLVKEGHHPRLIVTNQEGKTVFSIPLIDYLLLVKGNYNKEMSDQEYLDRQDTWDMMFFIDNGFWVSSSVIINSWVVVPEQEDILH